MKSNLDKIEEIPDKVLEETPFAKIKAPYIKLTDLNLKNPNRCECILADKHKFFLHGHTSPIYKVLITSDSKYIITGSSGLDDYSLRIWNLQERKQEAILTGHSGIYLIALR